MLADFDFHHRSFGTVTLGESTITSHTETRLIVSVGKTGAEQRVIETKNAEEKMMAQLDDTMKTNAKTNWKTALAVSLIVMVPLV